MIFVFPRSSHMFLGHTQLLSGHTGLFPGHTELLPRHTEYRIVSRAQKSAPQAHNMASWARGILPPPTALKSKKATKRNGYHKYKAEGKQKRKHKRKGQGQVSRMTQQEVLGVPQSRFHWLRTNICWTQIEFKKRIFEVELSSKKYFLNSIWVQKLFIRTQ